MKVLVWYVNLKVLKTKNTCQVPIPYWYLENVNSSLQIPELYKKRTTPVLHWWRLPQPFTN